MVSISASVALVLVAVLALAVKVESAPGLCLKDLPPELLTEIASHLSVRYHYEQFSMTSRQVRRALFDPEKLFREMFAETTPEHRLRLLISKLFKLFKGGDTSILGMAKGISTKEALIVYDRVVCSNLEPLDKIVSVARLTEMNPEIFHPILLGDASKFIKPNLRVKEPDLRVTFGRALAALPPVVIDTLSAIYVERMYDEPIHFFQTPSSTLGRQELVIRVFVTQLAEEFVQTPDDRPRHVLSDYTTIQALLDVGIRFPVIDFLLGVPLSISEFQTVAPLLSPQLCKMKVTMPFQDLSIVVSTTLPSSSVVAFLERHPDRYADLIELFGDRSNVSLQDLLELELHDLLQDVFAAMVRHPRVDLSRAADTCAALIALPHVSLYRKDKYSWPPIRLLFMRLPDSADVVYHPAFLEKILADPASFRNYVGLCSDEDRRKVVEFLKGCRNDDRLHQFADLLA